MVAHPDERSAHLGQLGLGPALGGKARRCRLQQAAQFEQVAHEGGIGPVGEHPGQNIGIEHVPPLARGDAGAGLGAALQQPLGDQGADRLAIGRARDAQRLAVLDLAGQRLAGGVFAVENGRAELPGNRLVNPQP